MLVTLKNLNDVCEQLGTAKVIGFDTETTGLRWKDRIFSLILSTESDNFYFNFNGCKDLEGKRPHTILPRTVLTKTLAPLFQDPHKTWAAHHAKFDLRMLYKDSITVNGTVHCTKTAERIIQNDLMSYSLDAIAKMRLGVAKDDGVSHYIKTAHLLTDAEKKFNNKQKSAKTRIKKPKCYDMELIPGKATRSRRPFFYKVPFDIIVPYGERDSELTLRLYHEQLQELATNPLWKMEREITKIVFEMECAGIKIDVPYVKEALQYENGMIKEAQKEFCVVADVDKYIAGPTQLAQVFDKFGFSYETTPKGNPCFNKAALKKLDNPVVDQLKVIREHEKKAGTYYSSFLYHMDEKEVLHCSLNPDGTDTGRFSSSAPNLQNVPKEDSDDLKFYVRKSFVSEEDFVFLMIDYDQQEFRMMLDYAGQMDLIYEILNGKDVHQATGDLAGVSRNEAKTLNYGLLYGMGNEKLGKTLGLTWQQASHLKQRYFNALPDVKDFIKICTQVAKERKFVRSWAGRIFHMPDPDFAYKAPNKIIQGGCADVLKYAMIECHKMLRPYKSHMKLQIHDEILFGIHKDEMHLAPQLLEIMENIYKPMNKMVLTCSASWSKTSWGYCDKIEGLPPSELVLDKSREVG